MSRAVSFFKKHNQRLLVCAILVFMASAAWGVAADGSRLAAFNLACLAMLLGHILTDWWRDRIDRSVAESAARFALHKRALVDKTFGDHPPNMREALYMLGDGLLQLQEKYELKVQAYQDGLTIQVGEPRVLADAERVAEEA